MVLVLMSAPCVVACPYSVTGNAASSSTDDGSCSSCEKTSSTDNLCSTCSNTFYSPYAYGAFKCVSGTCTGGYCVDGNCNTTEINDSSVGNASGAIICKDGTCEAKVCDGNGTCKTGSFSTSGDENTIAAWFSQIFGDDSSSDVTSEETNSYETENQEVSTPKAVNEETTIPSNSGITYSVAGSSASKKSTTNYFGSLAMSGNTESTETTSETTVSDVSKDSTCSDCKDGASCDTETCKSGCSQCDKAATTTVVDNSDETDIPLVVEDSDETDTPLVVNDSKGTATTTVTDTKEESSACASYDKVYAALRADKTEKKVLSESYTSLDFAQDVCTTMTTQGAKCTIIKVTFTDGSVNYLNAFDTCNGQLLVDSCGTTLGTGIKKQVTVLKVGQQWTAKSLFGECTKTYTRGIVSSIE